MGFSFLWPAVLWGWVAIPLLVALYLRYLRRPARYAVTYSTLTTLREATARRRRFWRHVPAACFGLAFTALVLAAARPVAPLPVPADRSAIILALDVSGSMRSRDIEPSRIEAAKTAAKSFVTSLPPRIRVGLVAFAGFASLVVPPVAEHARVIEAIDGLGMARRTAIGEGLLEAVAALPGRVRPDRDGSLPRLPPGLLPSGIVVLLSDGQSNTGIDPLKAAAIARQQSVRVYTVGLGQRIMSGTTWTIGGPLDEDTLQAIATITDGEYYHASSAHGLHDVYRTLARSLGWERRPTEVSALAAGLAAAALIAAVLTSWLGVHGTGL